MPWVRLIDSEQVAPGAAVGADVGDRELVVWRSASGRVCAMDARCPHQWSYLAAEGVVDGDELVCGAHFWRFDAEGKGTKQNLFGRRDEKASIEVFATRELDGSVEADIPE